MTNDSSTDVSLSVDGGNYGDSANAGAANSVSIWLQVAYAFNISQTNPKVDYDQPSFFFKLSNYDVEWVNDWENLTAADNSDGWKAWRNEYIGDNKYAPATYDVYRDENGEIYVIVTLNEKYIQYIKEEGNDQVQGNVKFSADVSRDDSQDGDKTIFEGEADLKVSFDDIDPTVKKEGGLTYQNDPTTGKPIIRWTITLNDFYELKNFALSDTHLNAMIPGTLRAVDENGQQIGISANGNNFIFDQETTTSKKITITYESVATDAELNDTSNGHKGFATNTVTLNYKDGVSSTGQVDLNADFKAHITKTGKPSYEVDGEKGYIYWTVTVSRNYKGSLDGYVVTDSIEGVDTSAMELVSVTGATVSGSAPWTISGHTPGENVVITYKTPVTKNQSSVVKNTASVTPPGGSTPDSSDPKQVIYNDTNLYTLNKTGSFDENTEKISWTITIDATGQNSLETLNGYVIEDDAFSRTDIENMTVTAWNDYGTIVSGVPITNIASLTDGKYVVNSTPAYDKIEIKYTVPLTTEEIADRADLKSGETLTAKNTVKVSSDGDNPDVETLEGKTSVPSGIIGISASKNWEGYFSDNDRTYPVTITLQKRLGYNGEWTDVEAKTITSASDDQKVEWNSLPKKENGESVFYRVVETVADDANYNVSYSNNNGVNYNSTIYITNTWKNMAVSVNKHWNGDSGHENDRPDEVRFELWQTYDWSEDWTNTGKYAILNTDTNDITYYNSDGTTTGVKAWSDLPRTEDGKVVYYKIVEEDVAGYTSNGGNVRQNSTGTITITNTADYFKLTANKVWDDGNYTEDRKEIIFDLYESTDNQTWTLKDYKTLSSMANENAVWDWLPSKDANGNNMYYKVEERDVPENYTASYSNNGGIQGNPGSDQYITITNTWQMMNVSVQKNWVNISDSERPGSVELELWRRIEGQAWEKVPDLGTVTVTASDYWKKDNAWTELPKTIVVDGVTAKIYYAAREVGTSTDYISTFDINGINNTGTSTVTNKPAKLNVTANKKWTYSTATLPNSITVHLEQSTDLGASWTTVADSEKTMNSDNNWGTTLEWNDLPVQDEHGQEILYRVVETEVEGFNTTYSPAQISANSGNITITNKQEVTYSKFAIKPRPYTGEKIGEISSSDGKNMQKEAIGQKIEYIASDDLVLSDDGAYYIFKWYLDLSTVDESVKDLLPDSATVLVDDNHPVMMWYSWGTAWCSNNIDHDTNFVINNNTITIGSSIAACSYYVKVPKEIVDNEIATTGKYVQTNKIKAEGETEYVEADLTVSNEGEA
ncbi:MAG: Cna B-type domain-containing protein, partial [Ruminococcus sp.]|nr:Cna B-type domain-containing protein [Ruminococcus sp.]